MLYTILAVTISVTSLAEASIVRELGQPDETPPLDSSLDSSWTEYKLSFNKTYDGTDETYRLVITTAADDILIFFPFKGHFQGPVVQSLVSLTSSLVVKMLTVLVSTICNSQVRYFCWKKMWVAFANAKATHFFFFSKKLAYMPYLMIKILTIC